MRLYFSPRRVTFANRGKSNQKRLPLHPAPAASRLGFPPSIAVPGARRHGPSWTEATFAASCRSTPYTTIPLGLLMGRAGASDISLEDVGQIMQSVIRKMGQSG